VIRRLYAALPGPAVVRVAIVVVAVVVAVVALFFLYDWIGTRFLDTGGSIG
jgi:hypothetical protein